MDRVAIIARLKKGAAARASELIAEGPPFDPAEARMVRHSVYLSADEVVFVFEGHQVEWAVDDLIDGPFHPRIRRALARWREIVDGSPRIARERFGWERVEADPAAVKTSRRSSLA